MSFDEHTKLVYADLDTIDPFSPEPVYSDCQACFSKDLYKDAGAGTQALLSVSYVFCHSPKALAPLAAAVGYFSVKIRNMSKTPCAIWHRV